jgi:alkanesulfonate monooxygenase SsuD/methylene tetrahydromethanopterin reductase-like flavin-dependent oxidoreductase (luciferase family)
VDEAVRLGCPIVIPTVSTGVRLPALLARRFREGWARAGHDPAQARVGLHLHCYVGAGTTNEARERWAPHQRTYLEWVMSILRAGAELPPHLAELGTPVAQAVCGSAEDVAAEVRGRLAALGGADVLMVQSDQGGLPFEEVIESLARFRTEVVPRLA